MISYELNTSSFYKTNETYCLAIEHLLNTLNVECFGECNSWGYEFSGSYIKNNITYDFSFYKSTISQNGVFIPMDSVITEGLDLEVYTLNKNHKIVIKKSKLKRLFMSSQLKELVNKPYYISINNVDSREIKDWISFFEKWQIYILRMKKGKLNFEINQRVEEPFKLIEATEKMIKFLV